MNYAIILATENKASISSCLDSILGKPMISYIIENLAKTQIDKILCVANTNNKSELLKSNSKIENLLEDTPLKILDKPVEATQFIKEEGYTLILPGNVPFLDAEILNDLILTHKKMNHKLTIGTTILSQPYGYGRIKRKNRKVIKVINELNTSKTDKLITEVFSGVLCINNQLLKAILNDFDSQEFYLEDIVEIVSKKNKIETYMIIDRHKAQGIKDLIELSLAEEKLKEQINLKWLQQGVRIENYKSVIIGPDVQLSEKVTIYANTRILGNTEIHKGATIGPNTTLIDAIIYEDALILDSVIENSKIQKKAIVGPYAHIRMHSVVGECNRIGNFVELKNTTLGHYTNAAHLAYIGDTMCGNGVNFGCGIVTVNYDGQKKHATTIGNNVFIGCNTNLIAPIHIKNNSYIAAGSTVTMDIEECDFVIARAKETIKKGYALKFGYKKVED